MWMTFFNDTYCQLSERFISNERWNRHLHSSRHLRREVNGYWTAYFPQTKLTRDGGSRFEKAFWETLFGSVDVLPVYGSLNTYFMMVTKWSDFVKDNDDDDDDKDDFGQYYRDNLIAQFKQNFYNKSFNHQDQNKRDDGLRRRKKFCWIVFLSMKEHHYQILFMIMITMTLE